MLVVIFIYFLPNILFLTTSFSFVYNFINLMSNQIKKMKICYHPINRQENCIVLSFKLIENTVDMHSV